VRIWGAGAAAPTARAPPKPPRARSRALPRTLKVGHERLCAAVERVDDLPRRRGRWREAACRWGMRGAGKTVGHGPARPLPPLPPSAAPHPPAARRRRRRRRGGQRLRQRVIGGTRARNRGAARARAIFRSTGPVISTRRSTSPGAGGAPRHASFSRMCLRAAAGGGEVGGARDRGASGSASGGGGPASAASSSSGRAACGAGSRA